jgi:cephalosporin hydroxylase
MRLEHIAEHGFFRTMARWIHAQAKLAEDRRGASTEEMLKYRPDEVSDGGRKFPLKSEPSVAPIQSEGSWLERNRRLIRENPRLFFRKLGTWMKPMRRDYRRRWNRGMRQWMRRYQTDVHFTKVTWMGVTARKMVLDSWVYQQIIHEVRPEIIIEIGNAEGGSTKFLANMLDLIGSGQVIAVDIDHSIFKGHHPRITLVTGDSLAPETLARVKELARGRKGLVIHDGDHSREHVLADLRAYAEFVSVRGYFIVEDTLIDLFRAGDGLGGVDGPLGAVEQFVEEDKRFQVDSDCEFFVLTYNPRGYLKRLA